MKAMFANLTRADFGGRSNRETRAAERRRVHGLFDEIQVALYAGDYARVDRLLTKLAVATTNQARAS